jgi:hypothetical protein
MFALMSLRGLPADQQSVWRMLFDHYVFQTGGDPTDALPPGQRYKGRDVDAERVARLKDALRDLLG